MTDYMTLEASAFPPSSWTFLPNCHPKPSQTSNNKLWIEMTNQYSQSMARRKDLVTENLLPATEYNASRMKLEVKEFYEQRRGLAFENAADVEEVLEIAERWAKKVVELSESPMETIQEVDEPDDSEEVKVLQIKRAINNWEDYQRLKDSHKIERSFRARLMRISANCHDFISPPVGDHPRLKWTQISRENGEVHAHVALVRQQVSSDIAKLRAFLRGRLFDQYGLMRSTPEAKKDPTWLEYGKFIISGYQNGEPQVGERLYSMINESGLDPNWVMDHIKDYHIGNEHIGQWQRYMQAHRWMDLAEKVTKDVQQLTKINSTKSNNRRCSIMFNIYNIKRQFFKRLNGAQDFELSENALRMEEEEEYDNLSTSSTSSSASSW